MKRRRVLFWAVVAVGCATAMLVLWAFWLEPASLTFVEERLDLPWTGDPLRVVVLADLHVGSPFNGIGRLREIVDRTNAAKPDVICVLGDLVTIQGGFGGRFVPPEEIASELGRLRASSGTFAVLGNHEGWFDHDRVRRAIDHAGIRVVEDTAEKIQTRAGPIWIAGVSDLWTGHPDLQAALAAVQDQFTPVILLTHNPDIFPEVPPRVTLTLAGHTHGGQVRLPVIGRRLTSSKFGQRFAAGRIVEGGRHLYVATGVGTSILPVRFRVPPTVVILTLERLGSASRVDTRGGTQRVQAPDP